MMVLNGSLVILMQIFRFVALRYESASSLQKMAFLTAVYSFIFDISFNGKYTTLQVVGLVTVLVVYVWQLIYFVWWEPRNKKKKEEETEKPAEVPKSIENRYSVNVEGLKLDISVESTTSTDVT